MGQEPWTRPIPDEVATQVTKGTKANVLGQSIEIPVWWPSHLGDVIGAGSWHLPDNGHLTRQDLFDAAAKYPDTPDGAAGLLWLSTAWGAGRHLRLCAKRIEAVRDDPRHAGSALCEARELAGSDPRAAYARMSHAIKYLGPAFFTKFLYFAGRGHPEHPCLILDANVARGLRAVKGQSLPTGGWGPDTYQTYCTLLHRWASEASTTSPVRADQIEYVLFQIGKGSAGGLA